MIEDLIEKVAKGELTESQAVDEMLGSELVGKIKTRIGTAWDAHKSKVVDSMHKVGTFMSKKVGGTLHKLANKWGAPKPTAPAGAP